MNTGASYKCLTEEEIKKGEPRISIHNGVISAFGFRIIGHFGNTIVMDMVMRGKIGSYCFLRGRNVTKSAGIICKTLFEVLKGGGAEDGEDVISGLIGTPLRLVFLDIGGGDLELIGIGNYMNDKFLLEEDFVRWLIEKENASS